MQNTALRFEKFVRNLLVALGYEALQYSHQIDKDSDIEVKFNNFIYAIEVKIYRSKRISLNTIETAAVQLSFIMVAPKIRTDS